MKRSMMAGFVLGLAGTGAHAQSSVTLYGLLDVGVAYVNNSATNGQGHPLFSMISGNIQATRWGIKGLEDLGGGMKAIFVLENGFSVANGKFMQGGDEFGRQAFVGLSTSRFGSITLGRQYDSVVDYTNILAENWALVSSSLFISRWPQRLWDFTEPYQYIGGEGGYGVGYGAPAAVGAAIAHAKAGRLAVNIQTDGDLMVLPGVLWTLAHHKVPLLTVMHNNQAWHQESMHVQRMADRRDRGADKGTVGTVLNDPAIDYAGMAKSMGMWAEGPISAPEDLAPALVRAIAQVKSGRPALLDVITQPR